MMRLKQSLALVHGGAGRDNERVGLDLVDLFRSTQNEITSPL